MAKINDVKLVISNFRDSGFIPRDIILPLKKAMAEELGGINSADKWPSDEELVLFNTNQKELSGLVDSWDWHMELLYRNLDITETEKATIVSMFKYLSAVIHNRPNHEKNSYNKNLTRLKELGISLKKIGISKRQQKHSMLRH